jgi:hypothetical protein
MTKKQLMVLLWFSAVIALSTRTVLLYLDQPDQNLQGELLLGHGLVMLVLAAPLSWPTVFVVGTLIGWFGISVTGAWDAVLVSTACGIAGYLVAPEILNSSSEPLQGVQPSVVVWASAGG